MQCKYCDISMSHLEGSIWECKSCGDKVDQTVENANRSKQYAFDKTTYSNKDLMKRVIESEDPVGEYLGTTEVDTTVNNGGSTDYYQLPQPDADGNYKPGEFKIKDFDDFAEWRKLNGFQFNMGKVMWTFNTGRHDGTDEIRDLNKMKHYIDRELQRLTRGK